MSKVKKLLGVERDRVRLARLDRVREQMRRGYVHFTTDRELPWKVRDIDGVVLAEFKTGCEATAFLHEWAAKQVAIAEAIDERELDAPSTQTKVEGDNAS
jgi:hypothetical protein